MQSLEEKIAEINARHGLRISLTNSSPVRALAPSTSASPSAPAPAAPAPAFTSPPPLPQRFGIPDPSLRVNSAMIEGSQLATNGASHSPAAVPAPAIAIPFTSTLTSPSSAPQNTGAPQNRSHIARPVAKTTASATEHTRKLLGDKPKAPQPKNTADKTAKVTPRHKTPTQGRRPTPSPAPEASSRSLTLDTGGSETKVGSDEPAGVERLYDAAIERRKAVIEKVKQEISEPSFQPTLYSTPRETAQTISGPERFEMLYAHAEQKTQKLDEKKKIKESSEAHSFKPTILRKSEQIARSKPRASATDKFTQLYKEAEEVKRKHAERAAVETSQTSMVLDTEAQNNLARRFAESDAKLQEKLKKIQEDENQRQMQECSFKPQLQTRRSNSASHVRSSSNSMPVHERLTMAAKLQEERRKDREAKEQLRISAEATFKPTLRTSRSEASFSRDDGSENSSVFDRLSARGRVSRAQLKSVEAEMYKDSTFKPRIPRSSSVRSRVRRDSASSDTSVHERLYNEVKVKEEELEKVRQEVAAKELQECSFTPSVKSSGKSSRRSKSVGAIWDRLATEDLHKQADLDRLRESTELQECTFKPNVSKGKMFPPAPKDGDVSGSVFDRLARHNTLEEAAVLAKLKEQHELEGCTFAPRVTADKSGVVSQDKPKIFERLTRAGEEKSARLEAMRQQEEKPSFSPQLIAKFRSSKTQRTDMDMQTHASETDADPRTNRRKSTGGISQDQAARMRQSTDGIKARTHTSNTRTSTNSSASVASSDTLTSNSLIASRARVSTTTSAVPTSNSRAIVSRSTSSPGSVAPTAHQQSAQHRSSRAAPEKAPTRSQTPTPARVKSSPSTPASGNTQTRWGTPVSTPGPGPTPNNTSSRPKSSSGIRRSHTPSPSAPTFGFDSNAKVLRGSRKSTGTPAPSIVPETGDPNTDVPSMPSNVPEAGNPNPNPNPSPDPQLLLPAFAPITSVMHPELNVEPHDASEELAAVSDMNLALGAESTEEFAKWQQELNARFEDMGMGIGMGTGAGAGALALKNFR